MATGSGTLTAISAATAGAGKNYWNVVAEVADYLGVGRSPQGDDLARVRSFINTGYRLFLSATSLDPRVTLPPYEWTFLTPEATLDLVADDYDYDLPASFGGLLGEFHYALNSGLGSIEPRPWSQIKALRAGSDTSGDPEFVAIVPKVMQTATGQTWEAQFWPTPAGAKTVTYRYNVFLADLDVALTSGSAVLSQLGGDGTEEYTGIEDTGATFTGDGLTALDKIVLSNSDGGIDGIHVLQSVVSDTVLTNDTTYESTFTCDYEVLPSAIYFLGGQWHSDTIEEFCLAVAEQRGDDVVGTHSVMATRLLQASIRKDSRFKASHLGYLVNSEGVGVRERHGSRDAVVHLSE